MHTFASAFPTSCIRGVAQSGSAPGLGPGGRRFESCRPDKKRRMLIRASSFLYTFIKFQPMAPFPKRANVLPSFPKTSKRLPLLSQNEQTSSPPFPKRANFLPSFSKASKPPPLLFQRRGRGGLLKKMSQPLFSLPPSGGPGWVLRGGL